mmetsp:Transcript_14459/g.33395  ORF Transcript_14459/g.33395 Transcript_14459/m.33395 type:complete len:84 (+) Transcript_14459:550-801(+)
MKTKRDAEIKSRSCEMKHAGDLGYTRGFLRNWWASLWVRIVYLPAFWQIVGLLTAGVFASRGGLVVVAGLKVRVRKHSAKNAE